MGAKLMTTLTHGNPLANPTSTAKGTVGQRMATADGRVWRYAKAGGTITVGKALARAPDVFDILVTYFGASAALAPVAGEGGAVGDKKVRMCVVTGTKTMTADEYANGLLMITDGAGEGYGYPIDTHPANGATGSILLTLGAEIKVALDNTSVGVVIKNPWMDVVIATHKDATGNPDESIVGVAPQAVTDDYYFWAQTWGDVVVQAGTATIIAGSNVILAEDADGSVQVPVAGETIIDTFGVGINDTANTIFGGVFLKISP